MLFFFDVTVNGLASSDSIGTEFHSLAEMRGEAIRSLIAIAKDEATDVDHQEFEITVRDIERPVYRAAVTFKGGLENSND